jgi:hypothetical protein
MTKVERQLSYIGIAKISGGSMGIAPNIDTFIRRRCGSRYLVLQVLDICDPGVNTHADCLAEVSLASVGIIREQ